MQKSVESMYWDSYVVIFVHTSTHPSCSTWPITTYTKTKGKEKFRSTTTWADRSIRIWWRDWDYQLTLQKLCKNRPSRYCKSPDGFERIGDEQSDSHSQFRSHCLGRRLKRCLFLVSVWGLQRVGVCEDLTPGRVIYAFLFFCFCFISFLRVFVCQHKAYNISFSMRHAALEWKCGRGRRLC